MLIVTAPVSAAASRATRLPAANAALPGRTITSTPMKPATTALQRRRRTTSPRKITAPMVTNNGEEYDSATASASGRFTIAQKPASMPPMPSTQRIT